MGTTGTAAAIVTAVVISIVARGVYSVPGVVPQPAGWTGIGVVSVATLAAGTDGAPERVLVAPAVLAVVVAIIAGATSIFTVVIARGIAVGGLGRVGRLRRLGRA